MNNLDKSYTNLLQDILDNGVTKQDRTGTGTLSVFGRQIRHKMSEGFPILTTKEVHFKSVVTELLWFLRGDTNIKWLIENGCNIWNGDAYKFYAISQIKKVKHQENEILEKGGWKHLCLEPNYLSQEEFINKIKTDKEFAEKWGDMGPIYGKQWRNWETIDNQEGVYNFDQIQNLIEELKSNPDSRRLIVNSWNVGELDQMKLPPCHYGFQVYTQKLDNEERCVYWANLHKKDISFTSKFDDEKLDSLGVPQRKISLMWNQRSVDVFLGLPFNISSYGLLLEIIAKEVNMIPDELIGNLGDTHLYLNHVEQAKEQIGRELSLDERKKIYEKEYTPGMEVLNDDWLESKLYTRDIPKRTREPFDLPTLKFKDHLNDFDSMLFDTSYGMLLRPIDFILEDYKHHDKISAPLSN